MEAHGPKEELAARTVEHIELLQAESPRHTPPHSSAPAFSTRTPSE